MGASYRESRYASQGDELNCRDWDEVLTKVYTSTGFSGGTSGAIYPVHFLWKKTEWTIPAAEYNLPQERHCVSQRPEAVILQFKEPLSAVERVRASLNPHAKSPWPPAVISRRY